MTVYDGICQVGRIPDESLCITALVAVPIPSAALRSCDARPGPAGGGSGRVGRRADGEPGPRRADSDFMFRVAGRWPPSTAWATSESSLPGSPWHCQCGPPASDSEAPARPRRPGGLALELGIEIETGPQRTPCRRLAARADAALRVAGRAVTRTSRPPAAAGRGRRRGN